MLVSDPVCSEFDRATIGSLLQSRNATQDQFRTGWFDKSLISASMFVFVVRTRRLFFSSRPGGWLAISTIHVGCVTRDR